MSYPFIILRNSIEQAAWLALAPQQRADALAGVSYANFQGHKFKAVSGSSKPYSLQKSGSSDRTISGKVDRVEMGIFKYYELLLRVKAQLYADETAACWGTLADLEAYYLLINPAPAVGQPSNVLTIMDHFGNEHAGFLEGDHVPDPLTTVIAGQESHFYIPVHFTVQGAIA